MFIYESMLLFCLTGNSTLDTTMASKLYTEDIAHAISSTVSEQPGIHNFLNVFIFIFIF